MDHNVTFINESQIKNQEIQLPFDVGRMSNFSSFGNQTSLVENGKHNCSMITNMTFIFTLGRKMPLYIDLISLVIGGLGIIGNLATIAIVAMNLKLRKPYYLTILTLAIADLYSIICMIGTIFLDFGLTMYIECLRPSFYFFVSFYLTAQVNSVLQVVLIAFVKFLLLVCPVKSKLFLTNGLIVGLFFVILFVSACCSFLPCYLIMERVKANEDTATIMIISLTMIIIPSILVIMLLHFVKVVRLRKSQALKKEVQKMNKVVSIILGIYVGYNIQKIVNQIVFMLTRNVVVMEIFLKIITISAFIHHASNPFVYAAFTPMVQKPWQRLKASCTRSRGRDQSRRDRSTEATCSS
jgi:hypothetical protein